MATRSTRILEAPFSVNSKDLSRSYAHARFQVICSLCCTVDISSRFFVVIVTVSTLKGTQVYYKYAHHGDSWKSISSPIWIGNTNNRRALLLRALPTKALYSPSLITSRPALAQTFMHHSQQQQYNLGINYCILSSTADIQKFRRP